MPRVNPITEDTYCYACERLLAPAAWTYKRSTCDDCERRRAREWHARNRERSHKAARDWKARNTDRVDEHKHKSNMKTYGLTPEAYDEMLAKQRFSCAVCGLHQTEQKKRLAVDHCHSTGKVRGLLCQGCNLGIGSMRDSPNILREAAAYLEGAL